MSQGTGCHTQSAEEGQSGLPGRCVHPAHELPWKGFKEEPHLQGVTGERKEKVFCPAQGNPPNTLPPQAPHAAPLGC